MPATAATAEVETPTIPEEDENPRTTATSEANIPATPVESEAPATTEVQPGGAPATPEVNRPANEAQVEDEELIYLISFVLTGKINVIINKL